MINRSIDFCINSTDEDHYNRIKVTLQGPHTEYSKLMVTTLTTMCNIVCIDKDDYLEVMFPSLNQTIRFQINYESKDVNIRKVMEDLNTIIDNKIKELKLDDFVTFLLEIDSLERITFACSVGFKIVNATHKLKLILGMYNVNEELMSEFEGGLYYVRLKSVGFVLSTPVLYLTSNVGEQCYRTINNEKVMGTKIVMKINNSFMLGQNMILSNCEFETQIHSSDLGNLEFCLVDAYMEEIKLLSPMYLTIHVDAIPDEGETPDYTVNKNALNLDLLNVQNQSQGLTFSGLSVNDILKTNETVVDEETYAEIMDVIEDAEELKRIQIVENES